MKNLLLVCLLALGISFGSCSSLNKHKTVTHENLDSVVNTVKDTTTVSKQTVDTHGFDASGVDIEFDYGTDSTYNTDSTINLNPKDPMYNVIKNAVAASGHAGKLPSKVKVHFDTVKDTTSHVTTIDSTHAKVNTNANIKRTVDTKNKDVARKGLSVGADIGIGLGILLLLAAIIYAVYKKIKVI